MGDRKRQRDAEAEDRRKKGQLNGREIFLQEGFVAQDDASAADDYNREDDDEADINRMFAVARENAEKARQAQPAGACPREGWAEVGCWRQRRAYAAAKMLRGAVRGCCTSIDTLLHPLLVACCVQICCWSPII